MASMHPVKRLITVGEIILNEEVKRIKTYWIVGMLAICLLLIGTISTTAILVYLYIQQIRLII